ncbi:MAG TPA: hypothetical protein VMT64_12855 [Candidatus Binataceae bacterium]|nr:hypothetical protein [Candidatus Binataceae bacterium]
MPDEFRMVRYTPADRRGVFELMRAAVSEQYANHLMGQWDWKYDSHPLNAEAERARQAHWMAFLPRMREMYPPEVQASWGVRLEPLNQVTEDAPYILLLKDGERVVAMTATMPQEFMIDGKRRLVAVGCDSAVHPDYRGKFLSMRMTLRLGAEHPLVVTWSNRATVKVRTAFRKRTASEQPARHPGPVGMRITAQVKPLDWSYMMKRETGIGLPKSVARLMAANRARHPATAARMPDVDVFNLESFDHRIDDLWHRASTTHPVIGIRDSNYLNWRFNLRPHAGYQRLAARRGDDLIGYLIFRIVEQDGARSGHIVDFLSEGDPSGVFAYLLQRAEEQMLAAGVKSVVCAMAHPHSRRVLRRSGFFPAVFAEPRFMTVGITQPDPEVSGFQDLPQWFMTSADGDTDMIF